MRYPLAQGASRCAHSSSSTMADTNMAEVPTTTTTTTSISAPSSASSSRAPSVASSASSKGKKVEYDPQLEAPFIAVNYRDVKDLHRKGKKEFIDFIQNPEKADNIFKLFGDMITDLDLLDDMYVLVCVCVFYMYFFFLYTALFIYFYFYLFIFIFIEGTVRQSSPRPSAFRSWKTKSFGTTSM
jgi:hypothetical protein